MFFKTIDVALSMRIHPARREEESLWGDPALRAGVFLSMRRYESAKIRAGAKVPEALSVRAGGLRGGPFGYLGSFSVSFSGTTSSELRNFPEGSNRASTLPLAVFMTNS